MSQKQSITNSFFISFFTRSQYVDIKISFPNFELGELGLNQIRIKYCDQYLDFNDIPHSSQFWLFNILTFHQVSQNDVNSSTILFHRQYSQSNINQTTIIQHNCSIQPFGQIKLETIKNGSAQIKHLTIGQGNQIIINSKTYYCLIEINSDWYTCLLPRTDAGYLNYGLITIYSSYCTLFFNGFEDEFCEIKCSYRCEQCVDRVNCTKCAENRVPPDCRCPLGMIDRSGSSKCYRNDIQNNLAYGKIQDIVRFNLSIESKYLPQEDLISPYRIIILGLGRLDMRGSSRSIIFNEAGFRGQASDSLVYQLQVSSNGYSAITDLPLKDQFKQKVSEPLKQQNFLYNLDKKLNFFTGSWANPYVIASIIGIDYVAQEKQFLVSLDVKSFNDDSLEIELTSIGSLIINRLQIQIVVLEKQSYVCQNKTQIDQQGIEYGNQSRSKQIKCPKPFPFPYSNQYVIGFNSLDISFQDSYSLSFDISLQPFLNDMSDPVIDISTCKYNLIIQGSDSILNEIGYVIIWPLSGCALFSKQNNCRENQFYFPNGNGTSCQSLFIPTQTFPFCLPCSISDFRAGSKQNCICSVESNYLNSFDQFDRYCFNCHKSCDSCNTNNECLTCKNIEGLIYDESSLTCNCGTGMYWEEIGKCSVCSTGCLKCIDRTVCKLCDFGYYQEMNHCSLCPSQCQTCILNFQDEKLPKCIACRLAQTQLPNCYCDSGLYFGEDLICHSCSKRCILCFSFDRCFDCQPLRSGVQCLCIQGYFEDKDLNCNKCNSRCNQCLDSNTCLDCNDRFINPPLCQTCQQGFRLSNGSCLEYNLDRCQIVADVEGQCAYCKDKSALLPYCICSDGYFYSSEQDQCQACNSRCQSCLSNIECLTCHSHGNPPKCFCPQEYFQNGSMCVHCQRKCRTCSNENLCLQCIETAFMLDGNCVSSCPITYFYDNVRTCLRCQEQCVSCKNNPNHCLSCQQNYILKDNQCVVECPEGYFSTKQRKCIKCPIKCTTCLNNYKCLSCPSDEKLFFGRTCIKKCLQKLISCSLCKNEGSYCYQYLEINFQASLISSNIFAQVIVIEMSSSTNLLQTQLNESQTSQIVQIKLTDLNSQDDFIYILNLDVSTQKIKLNVYIFNSVQNIEGRLRVLEHNLFIDDQGVSPDPKKNITFNFSLLQSNDQTSTLNQLSRIFQDKLQQIDTESFFLKFLCQLSILASVLSITQPLVALYLLNVTWNENSLIVQRIFLTAYFVGGNTSAILSSSDDSIQQKANLLSIYQQNLQTITSDVVLLLFCLLIIIGSIYKNRQVYQQIGSILLEGYYLKIMMVLLIHPRFDFNNFMNFFFILVTIYNFGFTFLKQQRAYKQSEKPQRRILRQNMMKSILLSDLDLQNKIRTFYHLITFVWKMIFLFVLINQNNRNNIIILEYICFAKFILLKMIKPYISTAKQYIFETSDFLYFLIMTTLRFNQPISNLVSMQLYISINIFYLFWDLIYKIIVIITSKLFQNFSYEQQLLQDLCIKDGKNQVLQLKIEFLFFSQAIREDLLKDIRVQKDIKKFYNRRILMLSKHQRVTFLKKVRSLMYLNLLNNSHLATTSLTIQDGSTNP